MAAPGTAARNHRGSVLVVVLITLVFTAVMLLTFIDKASTDLIVESRVVEARRLRVEAYSALEVTLAVLDNFRTVGGGSLRSPAEGWSDPLGFAAWEPSNGRKVDIEFDDESGKLSLAQIDLNTLVALFKSWEMTQTDADRLADALMTWMKKDYVATGTALSDYENGELPYKVPARSLRSFQELAAIDVAREVFYGKDGTPNELWWRFANAVSLYDYKQPNINSARPDVLAALAGLPLSQQQSMADYLAGAGSYRNRGPGFFQSLGEAVPVVGPVNFKGFGTQIQALRIRVTVHEGRSIFRLTAVVAPPGGAQTVQANATEGAATASTPPAATPAANPATPSTPSTAAPKKLNYPFTVLEITENDELLPVPPASPPNHV